jgi:hypothetical protein
MTVEGGRPIPEERTPQPRRPGRPPSREKSDPVPVAPEWEEYKPMILGRGLKEGVSITKGGIMISAPLAQQFTKPKIKILFNLARARLGLQETETEGYTATKQPGGCIVINCKGAVKNLHLKPGHYPATWTPQIDALIIEEAMTHE